MKFVSVASNDLFIGSVCLGKKGGREALLEDGKCVGYCCSVTAHRIALHSLFSCFAHPASVKKIFPTCPGAFVSNIIVKWDGGVGVSTMIGLQLVQKTL